LEWCDVVIGSCVAGQNPTAPENGYCEYDFSAKGQCLNCMDGQEYDLTVPANRRDLIHAIEIVTPKADVRLTANSGHLILESLTESVS